MMKMLFSSRQPKILSSYAYIYSQEKHIVRVNDTVSIRFTIGSFSVDVINCQYIASVHATAAVVLCSRTTTTTTTATSSSSQPISLNAAKYDTIKSISTTTTATTTKNTIKSIGSL